MVENDIWEKEENLENVKELVDEFEKRISVEVRQQEGVEKRQRVKLNPKAEEFKRSKLPERYIAKMLYRQDNGKFENEYVRKLEKSWQEQKSVSLEKKS